MSGYRFFNRDESWLSFNERVLMEAANENVPLMERFKFMSIYSANLDEFYRVRMPAIAALQKIAAGQSVDNVYTEIVAIVNRQQSRFGIILNSELIPALGMQGYYLLNNGFIPESLYYTVELYFFSQVAGYLHPVPLIPGTLFFPENNRLYQVIALQREGVEQLFLLNIPAEHMPRFFKIKRQEGVYIIFLEDVIRLNLKHVFGDATITGAYNVKITRDAALDLADEYEEDIAEKIEYQLSQRDFGWATRFLYEPGMPLGLLQLIVELFNLQKASVIKGGKHHHLKDLGSLPIYYAALYYQPRPVLQPLQHLLCTKTLLQLIGDADQIVHTPYQSYDAIIRFFNEAAIDQTVTEIYTTLYRVASHSRIVHALISAAKNGKKVVVLVELKARFDEANNLYWSRQMKAAGVRIVHSSNALKVHAKVALLKRVDPTQPLVGLLATGNLNEITAGFYTDHILLTAFQPMLNELEKLFSFLSQKKKPDVNDGLNFDHLLVAQFNLLERFLDLIAREKQNALAGLPAVITIKLNNLEEETLIAALYDASNAGVTINLLVRSICRLVPGIAGQSANITVKRIVDRYLEHGRIFVFHNNGAESVYLGSADWMNRNIYHRIEVCFPLYDAAIRRQVLEMIHLQWRDNVQAVYIDDQLNNIPVQSVPPLVQSQEAIYQLLAETTREQLKMKV